MVGLISKARYFGFYTTFFTDSETKDEENITVNFNKINSILTPFLLIMSISSQKVIHLWSFFFQSCHRWRHLHLQRLSLCDPHITCNKVNILVYYTCQNIDSCKPLPEQLNQNPWEYSQNLQIHCVLQVIQIHVKNQNLLF